MTVRIENTKPIHIDLICNNLREEDKQEYYHTVGIPKNDHYVNCYFHNYYNLIKNEEECKTLIIEDKPCVLYGITKQDDPPKIWLIASKDINNHKMIFLRFMREHIKNWKKDFPTLSCLIWEGNRTHLYWAYKSGGTVKSIEKHGPYQENFYIIEF